MDTLDEDYFPQSLMLNVRLLAIHIREKTKLLLEGTRAAEMFDNCCDLIEESYLLKFLLILIVVNSILPALAFVSFAVLTLVTTFTGFLVVEGAILILGACAAILWFGLIGVLFILLAICITLFCLLFKRIGNIAQKVEQFYSSHISESVDDDLVVVENDHED